MKTTPERVIYVLGHCFSGTFEHLRAPWEVFYLPHCVIGASRLHGSLSDKTGPEAQLGERWTAALGKNPWHANVFLLNFFAWIVVRVDVDGDGHPSLLDAYKWAAIRTNEHLRQLKMDSTQQVMADNFQVAAQSAQASQTGDDDVITRSRLEQRVNAKLETIYTQQEPWIENPSMAHQVRFADLPS